VRVEGMVCGGWDTEPASTKKSGGEDRFLFLYGVASRHLKSTEISG
jgi:hypothetical protein